MSKQITDFMKLLKLIELDQKDFAEAIGVTPHTVTNWVRGKTKPKLTLGEWRKVAQILGVPLEKLPDDFTADIDPSILATKAAERPGQYSIS